MSKNIYSEYTLNGKPIKQSVINTFNKYDIPFEKLLNITEKFTVANRFTEEECLTSYLIKYLVGWVYKTSNQYEDGIYTIKINDFDRVRYFILEIDSEVYMTCID